MRFATNKHTLHYGVYAFLKKSLCFDSSVFLKLNSQHFITIRDLRNTMSGANHLIFNIHVALKQRLRQNHYHTNNASFACNIY